MLTIFATPKAFRGHLAVIQRNAITSWTRLSPRPQIIVFGDSYGTKDIAAEFGLEYFPQIESNEFGTPYLGAMIARAERIARFDLLCYINADIILTDGFERAIERVRGKMRHFLMVGRRVNMDLDQLIRFDANWREWLSQEMARRGLPGDHTSIDFFVFANGLYRNVPPLVIGRAWFDQWMIKAALAQRVPVVDASALVPIVHQNHDYTHVEGGSNWVLRGVEAERNLAFCGGQHRYTLLDVTHELEPSGAIRKVRLRRTLFEAKGFLWKAFIRRAASIRDVLKLNRKHWHPKPSRNQ